MSWLKVDDGFTEHPKVLELSDRAFRIHVRAMGWAARQETDGRVSAAAQRALGATKAVVDELEKARLWDPEPGGHIIHDFLEYNPSRAQLEAARLATRERVNRHRSAPGNGSPPSNVTASVTPLHQPLVTALPTRPDPTRPEPNGSSGIPAPAAPARVREVPSPIPEDWQPSGSQVDALAEKHAVDPAKIRAVVSEFRWYWREGEGAGKRKSGRGWAQAFGNRIDMLASKGTLYADRGPARAITGGLSPMEALRRRAEGQE